MRNRLLLALLALGPLLANAQAITGNVVPSTYDRSSLTIFYLDYGDAPHWAAMRESLSRIGFPDKFDLNNYTGLFLPAPFARDAPGEVKREKILAKIREIRASHHIVAKWYSRQPDGTKSLDLVHQRGRFTATDADFLRAQTTKRGNAALEDFGNRLIDRSYILVIDVPKLESVGGELKGWKATVTGYLYKLDYNQEVRNVVYENWIYEDDPPAVREQKRRAFDALDIPVNFVLNVGRDLSATQPREPSILFKPKTTEELMQDLAQMTLDETLYLIEMQHEDFRVKTPLYATRPLRAKIGLKEGLRTDHRFFAFEHVFNQRTNQVEVRRRGVIRATSEIVDNRVVATGDMQPSRFYQVAGRRLEPGYLLQQRNDHGVEVLVGAETGIISGLYARIDYRLGRFVGIPAFYAYLDAGIDAQEYRLWGTEAEESYTFTRVSVGFAKGYHFLRHFEVRPYLGLGREATSIDEEATSIDKESINTLFLRAGANLGLNITHNVHLVGGVGIYAPFGSVQDEDENDYADAWTELFQGRRGASRTIGLRILF